MTATMTNPGHQYLNCEEDGLLMRRTGAWATEKLDYLCRYLKIFTTSMRTKPWRGLHFIDLFSGPGKCQIRGTNQIMLGSPLLSMKLEYPFSRYFFVDADPTAIDALKLRCGSSDQSAHIQYQVGNSNQVVTSIVKQIEAIDRQYLKDKWPSLNLAFLDPEGFELEWTTVASLGKIQRMDLIIYYPQMGLTREIRKDFQNPEYTKIDAYFGGTEWRDVYQKYQLGQIQSLHRSLLDLYEGKLKSLGYVEIKENEPLMRNTGRNAPLYRLIFASKHPLGNKFWREVTNRNVYGQTKFC
ncbi:MAG: three-Cys-motif partner protein TcmP [Anaerolineaceae bacterium]|nr:three-Cys-motif partner protein TcmP [Anaerolineaceae bacterium]